MRVVDFLDFAAERAPERDFLVDGETRLSYRHAVALTHRIAGALRRMAIAPGDSVATLSPNSAESALAEFGILRAGAVWVPLNTRSSGADIAAALALTEARLVFYSAKYADLARELRALSAGVSHWICLENTGTETGIVEWAGSTAEISPVVADSPNALFALMLTSGTTGMPKAVQMTNLMYETLINAWAAYFPYDVPPVHLCTAPLTHAAGAVMHTLLPHSATNVIMREFDAGQVLKNIEKHKITTVFLTPTMIYMLLSHPDIRKYDYSSLRYIHYFAAPMAVEKLKEAVSVFGPVLVQAFGQTEMPVAATLFGKRDHAEALSDPALEHRLASAGRASHVCMVGIMDDEGNILPRGERGEIVCRSNLVTPGYLKNPDATQEIKQFGWHHTGDIGRIDADGFVYILDRKKDMIISGGFNVFPNEIEQVLMAEPAIRDCAVVGVPDDKWGEAVVGVVELREGARLDIDTALERCKAKLGSIKTPKRIEIWPALPRSENGKVLKRIVRDKFWAGRARKISI